MKIAVTGATPFDPHGLPADSTELRVNHVVGRAIDAVSPREQQTKWFEKPWLATTDYAEVGRPRQRGCAGSAVLGSLTTASSRIGARRPKGDRTPLQRDTDP